MVREHAIRQLSETAFREHVFFALGDFDLSYLLLSCVSCQTLNDHGQQFVALLLKTLRAHWNHSKPKLKACFYSKFLYNYTSSLSLYH